MQLKEKVAATLNKIDTLIVLRKQQLEKAGRADKGTVCGDVWRPGKEYYGLGNKAFIGVRGA